MAWDSPRCIPDLCCQWSQQICQIALKLSFNNFTILPSPELPPAVSGKDTHLLRIECFNLVPEIIAFSPSEVWIALTEWSWSSFSLKNWTTSGVPSNIPVAHCHPVTSIQLLCSLIPPWHIEFWRFPHPNICLPLLSIVFDINVKKSVSLFVSIPLLTRRSPPGAASSILSNLW